MGRLHYMVFKSSLVITSYKPEIGHVVKVETLASTGTGMIGQVIGEERTGYQLKYPSMDSLKVLRKTVPGHWSFQQVDNTLQELAAKRFWHSGLEKTFNGVVFRRWPELPTFIDAWGELDLCELLLIAHPTIGANNDFTPRVKLLLDKHLIEWLAESAEFPAVREAAIRVLAER